MGLALRHMNTGSDPSRQLGQCSPTNRTVLPNFKTNYQNSSHTKLTAIVGDLTLLKSLKKAHCYT